MESNNDNSNYEESQQLRSSPRKRKFNELANNDQPAAATEEEQKQHQLQENLSKKKREPGIDDLEFESLSREDLIKLVRMTKKEAEESASRQAEDFFQQIDHLKQEKAEVQENLDKKMTQIVEMHKEVEEKSGELAEKAKQIDALLFQLNESTSELHQMPTEQEKEMKIQLSLETWYDMLAFVPRHRLGKVIPMIGDRKFASIVQKFLHKYKEISIDVIQIVAPYEEDPSDHPRVRARQLRFKMAEAQIPANIKNFKRIELSYFDLSVLNFLQKFQQNGLLDNVNLVFDKLSAKDIVQPVLCHLLPLLNGIVSIFVTSAQLIHFYDAENSKEIYELNMKMMENTLCLGISYDAQNLDANKIVLYCRWLYQPAPARADGKPRMLFLGKLNVDPAPISLFIDRLKQDFLTATNPVTFVIRIILPKAFQPQENICLDNDKTKERLLIGMEKADPNWNKSAVLISRYLIASGGKKFIDGKEIYQKRIYLTKELKVVAI